MAIVRVPVLRFLLQLGALFNFPAIGGQLLHLPREHIRIGIRTFTHVRKECKTSAGLSPLA